MKKIWTTVALTAALLVAGCGGSKTSYAQGVSEDEIKIGAVITSTGLYAAVGVPYGNFYKSFVAYINANQDDYADALDGKKINSTIYDEGGDGAVGKTYVQKLINDDKVFSLVGILGTWNLVAAQAELETAGIPSVYFGTGSSYQMYEPAVGDQRYMMGVQPLYKTEGRLMYLRALTSFDNVQKIGVIHSSADDGLSLKAGIEAQAALDTRTNKPTIVYQQ
ncbi:MAG: ABC transporter substrate-binding protein, partial [Bacilli bacterium]|nr:ABC transporter substrate-binding protein [Bacilli bacterium]